jgi:hypothetical protein
VQPGDQPPDPDQNSGRDPAAAKFWTLQGIRLVGIVTAMAGAAGVAEKLAMPQWAAGLLLAAGVGIYFGLPVALARKWKAER